MKANNMKRVLAMMVMTSLVLMVFPEMAHSSKQREKIKPMMTYLENESIKIGVDLAIGGSITWLSQKNGPNMVNSFDWGRQIQMSFYSGPNPFEPNGKKPHAAWKQLGWNPIQSGDCHDHPSTVLKHSNDGQEIYIKCRPMQWPLNNEPGECSFEMWIRLEGKVVHVRCRLNNDRDDKTQYDARHQEVPALYSNGPWYRVVTYTGPEPFANKALQEISRTPATPPFPWNRFKATEEWAALVDEKDHGFGVWSPGAQEYLGGFSGKAGAGGTKNPSTCYVSPLHTDILDHNIEYNYNYRLVVGTVSEIRQYVYENRSGAKGPDYVFKTDRQHWFYRNAKDTGFPIKGRLEVILEKDQPRVIGPWTCFDAQANKTLVIKAAFNTGEGQARLFWNRHGDDNNLTLENSLVFKVTSGENIQEISLDMQQHKNWQGAITRLALAPCEKGGKGKRFLLESVKGKSGK